MRLYLAGPEVFLPDAGAIGAAKKAVCARHGAEGVFPLDPRPGPAGAAAEPWMRLFLKNEAHIRASDAMIANLTPFRGPSADPGTVWEAGFMRGLGRPVFGYANVAADFRERTLAFVAGTGRRRADGGWEDADGMAIEDFGLHDNLMIDGGIRASGGLVVSRPVPPGPAFWRDLAAFEACVEAAVRALRAPRPTPRPRPARSPPSAPSGSGPPRPAR